ncbi:glycine-rich domain-containing protein [Streptomyces sp. NPDC059371]|uniref:glycine-rich domain-containing protein n=1 Tax=Streptomyces sp. NPDC059371 TaxID=3346812 RepID=UPI00367DF05E
MTIALERPASTTNPMTLLSAEVAERITRRITADHPEISADIAHRIVSQAVAFIAASGRQPGQTLAPSALVDLGWHAFILHTVDYAAFCEKAAGRLVHHVPTDDGDTATEEAQRTRERTLAAISAAGFSVDRELWPDVAECTQCHAGCTDSPNN